MRFESGGMPVSESVLCSTFYLIFNSSTKGREECPVCLYPSSARTFALHVREAHDECLFSPLCLIT